MMYAFARDGGLPASRWLRQVHPQHRTPGPAIWVSAVLAIAVTLYGDAFLVLSTGAAVFLYISYILPSAAGLFAEGRSWTHKGPFNLGRASKPIAALATLGGAVLVFVGMQPPNEKVLYLTIALLLMLALFWFALGVRKQFKGPPTGQRIQGHQAHIREIESALGRGRLNAKSKRETGAAGQSACLPTANTESSGHEPPPEKPMLVTPEQLLAFTAAAMLITLSPGPDNLMVLSQGIARGRRQGVAFGLGCALGCLNHTVLAALGVSALIAASPLAFTLLKFAGGGYLIYLGWQALRSPRRPLPGLRQSERHTLDRHLPQRPDRQCDQPQGGVVLPRLPAAIRQPGSRPCRAANRRARPGLHAARRVDFRLSRLFLRRHRPMAGQEPPRQSVAGPRRRQRIHSAGLEADSGPRPLEARGFSGCHKKAGKPACRLFAVSRALEPVHDLASKDETRRKRLRKRNA
ncbi:LysE family transporter [Chromobacterium haemolyticum]|nr:LysE family transporter [Chromobacterium haemolyticum]